MWLRRRQWQCLRDDSGADDDRGAGAGTLLLFVPLTDPDGTDVDDLRRTVARELRERLSPRHVPDELHVVRALPRTLSGKKLEVPVKKILRGVPVDEAATRGALENPTALDDVAAIARER